MSTEVVFLGDDFTGASDSLAAYARRGWHSELVLAPDAGLALDHLDALGIPTDLRSLSPARAADEISRLWPTIERADPNVLHFKICSTFDSSPLIGSIGNAANQLATRFQPDIIAIIGGQPSLGRYCCFGNLFARATDGAMHRIDRHPVMSNHPVTPMHEADLRLHLQAQGLADLQLVTSPDLEDFEATRKVLSQGAVLFDVTSLEDQSRIAEILQQISGRQLLIGATSVAEILTHERSRPANPSARSSPASANIFLFAGSRSATTQAQIDASTADLKLKLTPDELRSGKIRDRAIAGLLQGASVLVHIDPHSDYALSADALADASSAFVAGVLDRADVGYLGLAGGDTSSRICQTLNFETLRFQKGQGAGVCVCTASHPDSRRDGMQVMLKGGQMGTQNIFDQFTDWAKTDQDFTQH
jgi:uncharacterized protein YgbK (DUF1537 family)